MSNKKHICPTCGLADCHLTRIIFFEGISGGRKSSTINTLTDKYPHLFVGIYLDFPDYLDEMGGNVIRGDPLTVKHIQVFYLTQYAMALRRAEAQYPHKHILVDRSELNSTLYDTVFTIMQQPMDEYFAVLDRQPNEFDQWYSPHLSQSMIVVNATPDQYAQMLDEMRARDNGIDILSTDYLEAQRLVFERLIRRYRQSTLCKHKVIAINRQFFDIKDLEDLRRLFSGINTPSRSIRSLLH
jgi:hypothetical protein